MQKSHVSWLCWSNIQITIQDMTYAHSGYLYELWYWVCYCMKESTCKHTGLSLDLSFCQAKCKPNPKSKTGIWDAIVASDKRTNYSIQHTLGLLTWTCCEMVLISFFTQSYSHAYLTPTEAQRLFRSKNRQMFKTQIRQCQKLNLDQSIACI